MNIQANKSGLSKPKQKRGLTLISSLILIVLVAIALVPLLRALSISLFVSGETESFPYENISSEAKSQVPNYPSFQREVIVNTPQPNLKDITVIVYWDLSGGVEQSVSFETYAANF